MKAHNFQPEILHFQVLMLKWHLAVKSLSLVESMFTVPAMMLVFFSFCYLPYWLNSAACQIVY